MPDGRTTTREPSSSRVAQAVGRRQPTDALREVLGADDRGPGQRRGRGRAQPSHRIRDDRQVLDPHRQLVGWCSPCARARSSSSSSKVRPCSLERRPRARAAAARRRCRPCPAPRPGRRSSRAPPRSRTRRPVDASDPLEPGQRLDVPHAVRPARSCRAATTTRSSSRSVPAAIAAARERDVHAEQRADLVAAQHAPTPVGLTDGGSAPVGVGVVGDHEVGVRTPRRASSARSIAPGSSGLGNATVGKSGSGSNCASTRTGAANPAARNVASTPSPTDAVHRGVHDGHRARGGWRDQRGNATEVVVDDAVVEGHPAVVRRGTDGHGADARRSRRRSRRPTGGTIWDPSPR